MLKFISKKITLQWFIFLGLLALAVYTIFTQTQLVNEEGTTLQYKNIAHYFSQYKLFGKIIIVLILLLQIYLLQYCFIKNEYICRNSLLPACFYLSILLLTGSLLKISPVFFTSLFFIITISINYTASSVVLKNNVFWAGMLIALGTCFDVSSIVLLFLVAVTLIINQFFKMKEMLILLFGFTLVYFYFFSYYFLKNSLTDWLLTFQEIRILGIVYDNSLSQTISILRFITLGLIYFYFMMRLQLINESKVVVLRKKTLTLNMWALLIIACLFISNTTLPKLLGYLFVPISIYLSIFANERNPFYINEIITVLTLLVICL
jgi:hypothetical protein